MKIHNQLPQGQLSSAVTRGLGDSRTEGSLERYSETLEVNLDLWARPEFALLRGETLFSVVLSLPAVAAEFGGASIINPVGSGLLGVVWCMIRGGGVNTYNWGMTTEAAVLATHASTFIGTALDGRKYRPGGFAGGGCGFNNSFGSDVAAQIVVQFDQTTTTAGGTDERTFRVPCIIRPGQAAIVEGAAVLTGCTATLWGWARKANTGELL